MATPSQYKERYENLEVVLKDGKPKTVSVNIYRLVGKNANSKARDDFRHALAKRGVDTELRIETDRGFMYVDPRLTQHEDAVKKGKQDLLLSGTGLPLDVLPSGQRQTHHPSRAVWDNRVDTRVVKDWDKLARLVFAGKGSPEACQAVLELANYWGLAPDVQIYANSALGLDCNGFVGNYLRHALQRKPWTSLAPDHELGPDSPIRTGFYDHYQHRLLDRWEALDTAKMYIMMEVDSKTGVVINGGTDPAHSGHIVITEPNARQDPPGKGGTKSFAVRVVESTGSHTPGLSKNWYTCVKYDSKTKIFTIDRGKDIDSVRRQILFKIAAVN